MKIRMHSSLNLAHLALVNEQRCRQWHPGFPEPDQGWTGGDWANAMQGEAGEAGNVVKKLRRIEEDYKGRLDEQDRDLLVTKLAEEIADTIIYADLLATYYGIDLGRAIIDKFNKVSELQGFPERLPDPNTIYADPRYCGEHDIYDCPYAHDDRTLRDLVE